MAKDAHETPKASITHASDILAALQIAVVSLPNPHSTAGSSTDGVAKDSKPKPGDEADDTDMSEEEEEESENFTSFSSFFGIKTASAANVHKNKNAGPALVSPPIRLAGGHRHHKT